MRSGMHMSKLGIDIQENVSLEGVYSTAHGSPYDRGSADSYYRRGYNPHYYPAGTYKGKRVEMHEMTPQEIVAYTKGYNDNEEDGNFKEW